MPEDNQIDLLEVTNEEFEPVAAEDEDDLGDLSARVLREAVLFSSDWTVETILAQLRRGTIQLNPRYQRRDAWRGELKSRYIESLFLNLPVPPLVFAEVRGKRGQYIVIDGKQRLLTLRQFAASKTDPEYERLALSKLEFLSSLNGRSMVDIEEREELSAQLQEFLSQPIRTFVIRNWPNESYLHLVFLRLNTGTVQLSPQELRQALNPGPFVDFTIEYSGESAGLRKILKQSRPDFRMRDVELLVRYFAFKLFLGNYNGNLKEFLDRSCESLNSFWAQREREINRQAKEFEQAVEATFGIFGEGAFRKFDGRRYEGRLNRAVFDIMVYYFSIPEIREVAKHHPEQIKGQFEMICTSDLGFRRTLESTTKSIDATRTRFQAWAVCLQSALGETVVPPQVGA